MDAMDLMWLIRAQSRSKTGEDDGEMRIYAVVPPETTAARITRQWVNRDRAMLLQGPAQVVESPRPITDDCRQRASFCLPYLHAVRTNANREIVRLTNQIALSCVVCLTAKWMLIG
jgi:hypothetical protein